MKVRQKIYITLFVLVGVYAWFYYQKINHERQIKHIHEVYETAKNFEKQGNFYRAYTYYNALCEGLESGIKREDLPNEACDKSLELLPKTRFDYKGK